MCTDIVENLSCSIHNACLSDYTTQILNINIATKIVSDSKLNRKFNETNKNLFMYNLTKEN